MKSSKKIQQIGKGCSRRAFILENNMIRKEPRYKSPYGSAGSPSDRLLEKLMKRYAKDPQVKKVQKLKDRGYILSFPCRGILAEYLVSLDIASKNSKLSNHIASCLEIKVRKRRNREEIGIVGFYENAFLKEYKASHKMPSIREELGYGISDLHSNNVIHGIIIDYASIRD